MSNPVSIRRNSILNYCRIRVQTVVVTQVSWENCGSESNDIKLLSLTISPDPIVAPGLVSITTTIYTNQKLTSPLKATVSLRKQLFITYITLPCFIIGSCTYDDLCTRYKQYNCPIEAGEHTFNIPMKINSTSRILAGKYQAQIDIETNSNGKGCAKINNISVKTN
ncbi:unnamed protein product [Rotaria sordida]|uniref:MD-2-related lipid-recognition domain-containing protein n=2 Tax=Rotaria sordida TaxID=392033 RepID=A0A819JUF3_9BILA|nr:unnamed protein product [Rotaria sordida]